MSEQNNLNIPAYQRKKEIDRKLKKGKKRPKVERIKKVSKVEETLHIPINSDPNLNDYTRQRLVGKSNIEEMELCGQIDGYFEKIHVVVIKTLKAFRAGDTLIFETAKGLFKQTVNSLQQNQKEISLARTGSDIGIKVLREPLVGGKVYKVL